MKQKHPDTAQAITDAYRADSTLANPSIDPVRWEVDSACALTTKAEAIQSLILQNPPGRGTSNELIQPDGLSSQGVNEALKSPNKVSLNASIDRMEMLKETNLLDLGLATAHDVKARNSIEQMLAHQLSAAHKYAMQSFADMDKHHDPVNKIKFGNLAVRLMDTFGRNSLVLERLQNGNNQTMTVQHVNVQGQAVITGSVQTGGRSND